VYTPGLWQGVHLKQTLEAHKRSHSGELLACGFLGCHATFSDPPTAADTNKRCTRRPARNVRRTFAAAIAAKSPTAVDQTMLVDTRPTVGRSLKASGSSVATKLLLQDTGMAFSSHRQPSIQKLKRGEKSRSIPQLATTLQAERHTHNTTLPVVIPLRCFTPHRRPSRTP